MPRLWWRGGVRCMFVSKVTLCFWHGWAAAWSGKSFQIYHKREKPQFALGWNLLQLKEKPKARGSREETNKKESLFLLEERSVCFQLGEEIWRSHFSLLSILCCFGSWPGQTAGHTQHVIRAATRHPAGHRVHLPLTQKHKSHQGNTGSKAAHKAQTCGRLLNTGQPRQRHRNRKSVTASHTWHELHTGSLFDMTAATELRSPATGWPDGNQPALTDHQLWSFYTSWQQDPGSHVTINHIKQDRIGKIRKRIEYRNYWSEGVIWGVSRERMTNEDRACGGKPGFLSAFVIGISPCVLSSSPRTGHVWTRCSWLGPDGICCPECFYQCLNTSCLQI